MSTNSHTSQPRLYPLRTSEEAFYDAASRICANLVLGLSLPLIDGSLLRWFELSDLIHQSAQTPYYAPKRGLYLLPSPGEPATRAQRLASIIDSAHRLPFCSWVHLGDATSLRQVLEASLQETSAFSQPSASLWRSLWDDLCLDHENNLNRLHESKRFAQSAQPMRPHTETITLGRPD